MTRVLLVPGRSAPMPGHWQSLWSHQHPEYRWASTPDTPYDPERRIADLRDAIAASTEPVVLVAHSAGCLTVARWAWLYTGPVRGALLVAPPYLRPARWNGSGAKDPTGSGDGTAEAGTSTGDGTAPESGTGTRGGTGTGCSFGVPGPVPETPRDRLPFPTFVVASRTDPAATFDQSRELAEAWDATLIDAGDAGHINTASGYGPWPAGEALLAELR